MLRLDEKANLIQEFCGVFSNISRYIGQVNPGVRVKGKYIGCLPKKAVRVMHNSLVKDLLKGLRQIDKKFPVYIELPSLKKEGNGMYSEQHDLPQQQSKVKEVIVSDIPQLASKDNQLLLE